MGNCRVGLGSQVEYKQMVPCAEAVFWDCFEKYRLAGYKLLQIIERPTEDKLTKIWIGVLYHG